METDAKNAFNMHYKIQFISQGDEVDGVTFLGVELRMLMLEIEYRVCSIVVVV